MDNPTAIELLRDVVATLPDEAEDHALAALSALAEPSVLVAALSEQDILDRLTAAKPHLVAMPGNVVADESQTRPDGTVVTGSHLARTDCPDCTRGTYSIGGVLVCVQLPPRVGSLNGNPGDIVACGKER
jgi:hypothetical protein